MSLVPRVTLIVACAAAVAALATSSTAAEISPSGGAPLSAGASPAQQAPAGSPSPAGTAVPTGTDVPTGAAPLNGRSRPTTSSSVTIAPALPAPTHIQFAGPTGPSGGVALFPLAHIARRLAWPHADHVRKAWTVRVNGRQLKFNQLARP